MQPGRKPASRIPSRVRHTAMDAKDWVKPMPIRTAPKETPRNESQFAGPARGRTRFYILSEDLFSVYIAVDGAYTGYFEKDIHDEEQHDDDGVAVAGELEVFVHARNSSEAEIGSVNERNSVHRAQNR